METKEVKFDLTEAPVSGVIEGYASVFSVTDQGGDIVEPGAFKGTLGSRKVRMLWQHDPDKPIGVWDEIREDDRGLYVKGRILEDLQLGREAIALFKAGAMDSLSIGYTTKDYEIDKRNRRLKAVELFEISAVTMPMNEHALAQVKAARTEREFERFLRDAGYSRKEATAIVLHGFKGLSGQRDAAADEADAEVKDFLSQIRQLQEKINV